jgi:hypothetical protein
MTFSNINNSYPKSLTFSKKESNIKLIVHGQGVFMFKTQEAENTKECCFSIYNKSQSNGLKVKFTSYAVLVNTIQTAEQLIDTNNKSGLTSKNGAYYWFSIDSQNEKLYAGIGEARIENVIYTYQFKDIKYSKQFLESLVSIHIPKTTSSYLQTITPLKLLRDPITQNVPMLIKNTNSLTMIDIAKNTYLPTAFLSPTEQKLYNCISGENFILNTSDFPDFSAAIEYNIATPGRWCYEKLKSKSTEFNTDKPNLLETYLRITLGQNNGESPGIPYVMEIWPPQHYSPIHNHGGASAVIRVLNGDINVSLFSYLCSDVDGIQPFNKVDFYKDDITWISPTLNQVHQLKNNNTENTCITIQCYMYENDNNTHYDYFDYIDDDGKKQQYEPDSDMDFVKFKETIKQEWENRPKIDIDEVNGVVEVPIIEKKLSCFEYFRKFLGF